MATAAKGRILVVDDEPRLVRQYTRAFERDEYVVARASNGIEATQLLASEDAFDAVVSDIGMPGMGGIELLRLARQRDEDLPVILMTGDPDVSTAIRAVDNGAFRYLVKPLRIEELCQAVGEAVRMRRLARLKRQALELAKQKEVESRDHRDLASGLDRAMASLWMAYQPIVEWRDKRAYAFEALLRSNEPSMPHAGLVLSAAEQLGRIHELGQAVRARVAEDIERCPAPRVFVNLHSADLLDDTLYAADAPLTRFSERIVFEITERASLSDVPDTAARIARLRALGFHIAVDDLGAGYAGLTAFTQIEPDVVKFDMSIVRDVHRNPTKRRLIQSMSELFAELGLQIVAEGVEIPEERDTLVELGCGLFQGYLFARPAKPFPLISW